MEEEMSMMCKNMQTYTAPHPEYAQLSHKRGAVNDAIHICKVQIWWQTFFADFFGVRVDTVYVTWEAGDVGTAGHIIDSRQTLHLIKL